jgi:hypothetical protein
MRAYHFLRDDMTAGSGDEPAWKTGEEHTYEGDIVICHSGYHSSPSWYDALQYALGSMACVVEIGDPVDQHPDKYVSRTRRLAACKNVERELRLFACECAERALRREREHGREPDVCSWQAIEVARRYAAGEATSGELASAWVAAWASARDVAWAAARDAAWDAARDAAWVAARDAAWDAEIDWQRQRLQEILDAAVCVEA